MADNITSPAVISYGCNTDKPSSPGPIGLGAFSDLGEAPIPVSSFVNVAGTIMICEVNTSASDFNITDGYFIPAGGWQTGTAGSSLYSGHLSTGNYLFCDGHVKALRPMATISVVMGGSGSVNMWDRKNQDYVSGYQYDNALAILTQAAKVYS